ncbi:ThiF family adenylyltransferase [Streptococcus halichoeri]|uniref:ThiF family adenylyltransferase n=1 Tax=Streptococcus halichoeri TaxID=254785 RepID=UPI001F2C493A|nr:ThiF family adenylyltransferase [Streptococcus halichoeri]
MKLKENIELYYDDETHKVVITGGVRTFLITDYDRTILNKLLDIETLSSNTDLGKFLIEKNLVYPDYKQYNKCVSINDRTLLYILDRAYSKQNLSDTDIEEVLNYPILIIGCGGVGTVVINNLVQAGFRKISVVDKDRVEKTNLNRQLLYAKEDVGKRKIEILEKKVSKINSNVELKKYGTYISNKAQLFEILSKDDYKIVVNCADTPDNIESIISEVCSEKGVPVISAYVGLETGTVNPIYDNVNPFNKSINVEVGRSLKASISTTNMLTSALLSQIIFDYLFKDIVVTSYDFYASHIINFKTMEIKTDVRK